MDFIVRQLSSRPDTALVRYDCPCGCKPGAEYHQGSEETGHEHCCCGNVHFVGPGARRELESYLADRRSQGMDVNRGAYRIEESSLDDPWGGRLAIAFGAPEHPGHE